jgi:hypothetical protein
MQRLRMLCTAQVFGAGNFPGYEDNEVIQQVTFRHHPVVA